MRCTAFASRRGLPAAMVAAALWSPQAWGQAVVPLLQNGPDSAKKIVAIIGDGYAAADMSQYASDAQSFVIDGAFAQDVALRKNHTAFNVYRVDAVSNHSGVSQRVYDENGTPTDASDDILVSSSVWDTALRYIYSGSWAHCWMEPGQGTEQRIADLLAATVPNADYVVVILNESGWGGCGGGGRLVFTRGMPWTVVPHEMGHGLFGLYDEYPKAQTFIGYLNDKNCSTVLDPGAVAWSALLQPGIALPTTFNPATMDSNTTVGMFPGCKACNMGIYRPVNDCRMNSGGTEFCPVCAGIIDTLLSSFVDGPADYDALVRWPGAACRGVGSTAVTYGADATARNMSASPLQLSCPVARIFPNGAANRAFAHVWVVDAHPSQDVCCHVESKNPLGTTLVGGEMCSSGNSPSNQVLSLDFPKLFDPYSFSHFHLDCVLPELSGATGSRVLTYRVGQQRF